VRSLRVLSLGRRRPLRLLRPPDAPAAVRCRDDVVQPGGACGAIAAPLGGGSAGRWPPRPPPRADTLLGSYDVGGRVPGDCPLAGDAVRASQWRSRPSASSSTEGCLQRSRPA